MQHLRNSPTSWTKLFTCGNIFKDTIDPQECPSEHFFNGLFGAQPNYKWMKRYKLIMCYPEKTIFHLSSHFKWMNRVSNLTAQTSAQFESWVVGLQNFVRIFPYSWELQNYGSAGSGTCGTSRARIFFLKKEECVECEVWFRA